MSSPSSSRSILCFLLGGYFTLIAGLPVGFIDEGVVTRDAIITGTFAPNPRNDNKPMLLLSSKNGQIYAVENPDTSEDNINIGNFESLLCTNGERGLQSVRVHPNFTENFFIYLYYTSFVEDCPEDPILGPPNHCSRFIMDPETLQIDIDSEVIILETSPAPKKIHNGGSMQFGVDGYLYVTTGDVGQRDPSYSQDLSNLYGSILRVDDAGVPPDDNPFSGVRCGQSGGVPPPDAPEGAVCSEIFAYGLRNPFRMSMDTNSKERVLFTIADVGASHWEEVSMGGADHVGANYGWPKHEGPCLIGKFDDCPLADDSITEPYYYYQHIALTEGGCATASVYVPEGIWPERYKFLFIDFVFGEIYNLVEDPDGGCRDCLPPVPAYLNETFYERELMIDMFFGPYKNSQALYIISRNEGQSIRRIRYTGTNNTAPMANFTVSDKMVDIDQAVFFDGSSSFDEDGDALTFLWNFGDGVTSTEASPEHTYVEFGQYIVKLTVTDALGQTNQVFDTVVCGTAPLATMVFPEETSRFRVGQEILVFGNATDSFGRALNDSQISWEVQQHHAEHFHPFLDKFVGNDFLLDPAPAPEDFSASTNSFLRIFMYATDSFGIESTVVRDIYPKKVFIELVSVPSGLEILVDEFPVTTPFNVTSWENHKLKLNALDQGLYVFESWSIGGDRKTNYTVPARNLTNPVITVVFSDGSTPWPTPAPTAKPVTATAKPVAATTSKPVVTTTTSTPVAAPPVSAPIPTAPTAIDLSTSENSGVSSLYGTSAFMVAAVLLLVLQQY